MIELIIWQFGSLYCDSREFKICVFSSLYCAELRRSVIKFNIMEPGLNISNQNDNKFHCFCLQIKLIVFLSNILATVVIFSKIFTKMVLFLDNR